MFTLDQLRAFVAVAEELHFGRAAERLRMTQPPLSRQIQKLERSLGVDLLMRSSKGVSLTAAGEAFLDESLSLLQRADQAPERARHIASGQQGIVRMGYTAASAFSTLGPLLSRLRAHLPGVTVKLHEMVSAEQLEALRSGSIDIGLARPPFHLKGVASRQILSEALVVAVPEGHWAAGRREISAADLRGEPIITYSFTQARYFHDLVVRSLDVHDEQVVHATSQIHTAMALVAAGLGVALVPASAAALGMRGLKLLPLEGSPSDVVQLHAMWSADSVNPALDLVISVLGGSEFLLRPSSD